MIPRSRRRLTRVLCNFHGGEGAANFHGGEVPVISTAEPPVFLRRTPSRIPTVAPIAFPRWPPGWPRRASRCRSADSHGAHQSPGGSRPDAMIARHSSSADAAGIVREPGPSGSSHCVNPRRLDRHSTAACACVNPASARMARSWAWLGDAPIGAASRERMRSSGDVETGIGIAWAHVPHNARMAGPMARWMDGA